MMHTTISFGPHIQLLIARTENRQVKSAVAMMYDKADGYTLEVEQDCAVLTSTVDGSIETHRKNIVYVNDIPKRAEPYESWLQSVVRRIALWCQNTALDHMLRQWLMDDNTAVLSTCRDLIDYVDHCDRIDLVRWIHWGLTRSEQRTTELFNAGELFEAFLDSVDQFGGSKDQISHILQCSVIWVGPEQLMSWVGTWIDNHPNTTRFHRWLRRWQYQYSNRDRTEWVAHVALDTAGYCIASNSKGEALSIAERELTIRSPSGTCTHVPLPSHLKPTASLGLWDGAWLLVSDEHIHRVVNNDGQYTFESEPILTVSRQAPFVGSFQGRPFIIGGEENDHTVCELWDRRDKIWLGFHMQSDRHLQHISVKECPDGIEILGRTGSKIEHWKLNFIGEQSGEWRLLTIIENTHSITSVIFVDIDIVGINRQTDGAALVRWQNNQWERITRLPEAIDETNCTIFYYDNNQLVVSLVASEGTNISILNALNGEVIVPKLLRPAGIHPRFTVLSDGTLLCVDEHHCHSIFV